MYCVSIEGNTTLLKNGLELIDEKGNVFKIKTIAMSHYKKVKNYRRFAELVLSGNVEEIGEILYFNH